MQDRTRSSIVLTGATGFLGAFLLAGLLERGFKVTVLGRPSKGISLSDRLSALVHWFEIAEPWDRLSSVEVDFSKERLGLDKEAYGHLCANSCKIIHCASDTSFAECNRAQVMATNVDNLSALLEYIYDAKTQHFYYISTAYACGICEGLCLEAPITSDRFTNVYEESKAQAEGIIIRFSENKDLTFSILRPSIVYGHSKTGRALKFNALYYAVKSLLAVRDIYLKDITEQGGKRSGQWGISLDDDGILCLPLSVCLERKGSVNLIPIDYFVESVLGIVEYSESGGIYHITNDDPPDINTLVDFSQRFLGVRGVRVVWDYSSKIAKLNPAEELLEKFIKPYRPYLSDTRAFDRSHTQNVIPGSITPPFSYDIFERCMTFAVECDWGKMLTLNH